MGGFRTGTFIYAVKSDGALVGVWECLKQNYDGGIWTYRDATPVDRARMKVNHGNSTPNQ